MADVISLAQDLWDIAQDDPAVLSTLKTERKSLVLAIAAGTTTGDIVNASKNGASYTQRPGYTLQDRRAALSVAINHIEGCIRPTHNQRIRFTQ